MNRTLEVIFRRPLSLLALLILLPVVGVAVAYMLPRSYESSASLWALQRYVIIGATGPETDLTSTPAETQATALTELLQARSFALAVANATSLPSTLDPSVQADPQERDDALYTEISTKVKVSGNGYNLFVITYDNKNPVIAQQVVAAVIKNYGEQSQGFTIVEGQLLLESYQTQLVKAKQDATAATNAEAKYIAQHPQESQAELVNDPQYAFLHAQTQQAQATLQNIQTEIATVNQEISTAGNGQSLFKILDAPIVPQKPLSRVKTLLFGGGIGLGVALAACVLYILIAIRRDRTVYTANELRNVAPLPVVLQLPLLRPTATSLLFQVPTAFDQLLGPAEDIDTFYLES
ncbi:MAG TPA: hypothetical protein VKV40_01270 [Ktedonobacteraceae bacterium]|nr:hypothetical protein [Ktedonobacteraceae bacterium]